ncbi:MAG: hypothetical protein KC680_04470 [Candidatus Peregrinibacteria bacterium]|nr:hypothetical protein [Candidatus Peregrinibacteria bacterium]MCB9807689.1 hypothetical protein [Candidatus Peribacteria bacterium]
MSTYRETHQPNRHPNKKLKEEPVETCSGADLELARENIDRLRRVLQSRNDEQIEAGIEDTEHQCAELLRMRDNGALPEVIADLKSTLEEARGYMR